MCGLFSDRSFPIKPIISEKNHFCGIITLELHLISPCVYYCLSSHQKQILSHASSWINWTLTALTWTRIKNCIKNVMAGACSQCRPLTGKDKTHPGPHAFYKDLLWVKTVSCFSQSLGVLQNQDKFDFVGISSACEKRVIIGEGRRGEGADISFEHPESVTNFWVVFRLCFKASPSAKPFIWKLFLFTCKWTL